MAKQIHYNAAEHMGKVLVAATGRGLCAVTLGDDVAAIELELRERFPPEIVAKLRFFLGAGRDQTRLTRAFTGRHARGISVRVFA